MIRTMIYKALAPTCARIPCGPWGGEMGVRRQCPLSDAGFAPKSWRQALSMSAICNSRQAKLVL